MIIGQLIILILLVLCIYFFNSIKYQVQVKYYTDKHKRKGDRKHEQRN